MPVWHERTRDWVAKGSLALLGVTQEQHADRCRLFAQWQHFDWPILHDPINWLESTAVPIVVAIDEHGIVRAVGPKPDTFERDFLERTFDNDAPPLPDRPAGVPNIASLEAIAAADPSPETWRTLGDAAAIWQGLPGASLAIDAYTNSLRLEPEDPLTLFRLGVAHRMRFESDSRLEGDFQAAATFWTKALELDPNQYIWRRRIEQYGPRLAKPYPFYDWVEQARAEIVSRGDIPYPLAEEPYGSELAGPARGGISPDAVPPAEPDPRGRINRDDRQLIEAEIAVVPARIRAGKAARVHITFGPSKPRQAFWNNESTPLRVWINAAEGWSLPTQLLEVPNAAQAESQETRRLDFELIAPPDATGTTRLSGYALYNACEQAGGTCQYLRLDLSFEIVVSD